MARDKLRRAMLPAAVFLACAFLLMPQAILGQRTYAGVDLVEAKSPYREALSRPPYVKSLIQTDQAESLAGRVSFFRALRDGTFQRWDPNLAGGQPTGILPLNALFSPFSIGFLFLPAWYAVGLKVFLALLFCQTFTYLLVRRLGAAVGPAVLAGVAYTFSGANLVFIHRVDAVFLVPALFWAVHRLVDGKAAWRGAVVLGGLVAWAWAEGFPSGWVFCVYATAAWAAWLAVRAGGRVRDVVRRAVLPAAGLVWGVALSAVTLVPFVSEVLDRGTLDVRVGPGAGQHIPSIQIFGLLDLSATGPPLTGPWWSGFNPVESVSHVGMIAAVAVAAGLLAAATGRIRLTREATDAWLFFCGMAVVGVVVNFVGTPLLSVVEQLPGIARNPIGRSRFLISLAVAVLGALTLDAWWARRREGAPPRAVSGLTLVVFAGAFALPAVDFMRAASGNNLLRYVTTHFALALLLAAAAALIAGNAFLRRTRRAYAGATLALAALLFAQLGWPLRHFTPEAPIGDFYGERAGHRALRELLDDRYRFTATEYNYYPNSGQALGLPDLRGLALHAKEFKAVIGAVNPTAFSRDALKINLRREEWNLTSPLLDHLAVRFFAEGGGELPFGRVADDADISWDRWASAATLPEDVTAGVAPGPLNGIYVPLRTPGKACRGAFVTLTLLSGTRVVATTTRPAFDVGGGWTGFAVLARSLRAGDPYRFTATTDKAACGVDVGLTGPRAARQLLIEDPDQAVRLVSTEESWIYERPSAWPLVSAHARWRAFPDQGSLLAWVASRPPADADVAPFVGSRTDSGAGAGPAPEVRSSRVEDNSVRAEVSSSAESLLVVSQNLAAGWRAKVDGRPAAIVPVDGALIGVFVPPGDHTVTLDYLPKTFVAGAGVTGVAVLAAVAVLIVPVLRNRAPRRRGAGVKPGRRGPPGR